MSYEDAIEELKRHIDIIIKNLVNDIGLIKLLDKLTVPIKEKFRK